MLPILQIGPLALPLPELLLLAGFWLGLELTEKQAHRFGADARQIYNLVLIALLAGIVGARLAYAAQSPAVFLTSPLSLLVPRPQMLDLPGGLVTAALAGLIYGQRRRMPLWPTLDALTTLFLVMAVTVGLANFASGDGFGAPARLPWAISLWGKMRHPSQVYETVAAILVGIAVWPGSQIASRSQAGTAGFRFWSFAALTAAVQLFLQGFRGDSVLLLDVIRQEQVIAWIALAISLWQVGKRLPVAHKTSVTQKTGAAQEHDAPVEE
jgi:phosphatidylglycerol:prolipoprotein diacylglycerol transferase